MFIDQEENGHLFCVLADFSMSTLAASTSKMGVKAFQKSKFKGLSIGYASPELLEEFANPTGAPVNPNLPAANDIYAFGITIYEVLARTDGWPLSMTEDDVVQNVTSGRRPDWIYVPDDKKSSRAYEILVSVATQCWSPDPAARPNTLDSLRQIETAKNFLR